MKTLRFLSFAMIIALAFASCGSNKQVANPTPQQQQAVQQQPQQQQQQPQQQQQQPQQQQQQYDGTPQYNNGETLLITPCLEEGLDKPGEYMAGFGVVEGRPTRDKAILDANRIASLELSEKFLGVIKNAATYYSKDQTTPSGGNSYESNVEGAAENVAKKVLNKYMNAVCRQLGKSTEGYSAYVAVQIPLKDASEDLEKQLKEELKGQFDQKKFREYMNQAIEEEYNNN